MFEGSLLSKGLNSEFWSLYRTEKQQGYWEAFHAPKMVPASVHHKTSNVGSSRYIYCSLCLSLESYKENFIYLPFVYAIRNMCASWFFLLADLFLAFFCTECLDFSFFLCLYLLQRLHAKQCADGIMFRTDVR